LISVEHQTGCTLHSSASASKTVHRTCVVEEALLPLVGALLKKISGETAVLRVVPARRPPPKPAEIWKMSFTKVSDRVSTFTRGSIDEGIRTAATRKVIPSTALNDVDTSIAQRVVKG